VKEITGKKLIHNNIAKNISGFNLKKVSGITSAYEVIRIINKIPLFFKDHYERLLQSLELLNIKVKISENELIDSINFLIQENKISNGNIKILVNYFETEKNIYYYFIKHFYPLKCYYKNGVNTIIYNAERINPNAKSILFNLRQSVDKEKLLKKVYEVILVDNNNYITEGSRSNIFFIKDDVIYTPPLHQVLGGITRKHVFNVCLKNNIKLIETKIKKNKLNNYSSAFLSGTSPKILPIKKIDEIKYNPNCDLLIKIIKEYDNVIINYLNNISSNY